MTDNGNPFESGGNWWMWQLVVIAGLVIAPFAWAWRKITGKNSP